ncbi:neurexin-3 [Willisornis vidua]|uniref:Neurexin-3 n=1 Tax=Willisornis vidua TaxID=1566151 RepID=A0ABQ9D9W1_9PASS|nr:neurexin-3 [Willisornis vidua]
MLKLGPCPLSPAQYPQGEEKVPGSDNKMTDSAPTPTLVTGPTAKQKNQHVLVSVSSIHEKKYWNQKSGHAAREDTPTKKGKKEVDEEGYSKAGPQQKEEKEETELTLSLFLKDLQDIKKISAIVEMDRRKIIVAPANQPVSFEDIAVLAALENCIASCKHEVSGLSRNVNELLNNMLINFIVKIWEEQVETMGFTLHSVYFTLKVSLLLGSLLGFCLGLEFMGIPSQWARYLRWDASTRSELSFQFKTNVSAGLLLYFDDGGVCDFLCLSLVDGRIQLQFSVDCAETTVITDKQVNDSNWHFLMVSRNHLRTVLVLDGEAKPGEVRPQRQYMNIVSDLFVGGVPLDIRPAALTLDGVLSEPPFQGFILDLKYGNSEPQLLGSQGVRLEMEGLCSENPCENGGTCFLLDGKPHCDCSATGYAGKLCSEDDHEATILFCLIADQLQTSGKREVKAPS